MSIFKMEMKIAPIIFEEPEFASKINSILESTKEEFNKRYTEILQVLKEPVNYNYENVAELFKTNFLKQLLKESIENALYTKEHDISKNIISILTKERVVLAIRGLPMIEAFEQVIKENLNATCEGLADTLDVGEIGLREKFLDKT